MSASRVAKATSHRSGGRFAALLKVQTKLSLREPYALLAGIGLPAVLLAVFGFIGRAVPGQVGDTGLSIIDLWVPTLLVVSLIGISTSLPTTLVRDREIGWLRRVSTTPLQPTLLLAVQLIIDLVLAAAAVLIIIGGGALVFGASLNVQLLPFAVSLLLAIAEIFALGLMLAALMPRAVGRSGRRRGGALRVVLPIGSVGAAGAGWRPFGDDHVLLAERRGCQGVA